MYTLIDELWNAPARNHARRKFGIGLAGALLVILGVIAAQFARADGYLLVGSYGSDSVLRYNEATGTFVDVFVPKKSGGLREPVGVVFGPDHNLYVASGQESNSGTGHKCVLRYNGATGEFVDVFADSNQLESPRACLFGPDGNLYVADGYSGRLGDRIVRFNGTTGAFIDNFVPAYSGGLAHPTYMVFGPDGKKDGKLDLYVGTAFDSTILRYDGTTGAFKGVFVTSGSGGLNVPGGMVFGPDGNLYVANANWFSNFPLWSAGSVLRYQGPGGRNPGAFMGVFIAPGSGGLGNPSGLLFGPDGKNDGKVALYVTSMAGFLGSDSGTLKLMSLPGSNMVLRYDGTTGAFLNTFVAPDDGGLNVPILMTFTDTDPTTLNYLGK